MAPFLGDMYCNPLFAEAILRNRGAIVDLGEREPPWTLPLREIKSGHDHIYRWDPWVRSHLVAQDLIGFMDFNVGVDRASKELEVTLLLPQHNAGTGQYRWYGAVRIVRPTPAVFEGQLDRVLTWAELREERAPEILCQVDNQHAFWGSMVPIHTDRMRHTRELLEAAVNMAVFVEMRFKHELACWRPCDYSPQVQPMVTTPGHGSLPSGHCTQSYVVLEVFKALLNLERARDEALTTQFSRLAARIATNRVIGGVHFPVDNAAGLVLGKILGEYFVYRCDPVITPPWHYAEFIGPNFSPDGEFDPLIDLPGRKLPTAYVYQKNRPPFGHTAKTRGQAAVANSVLSALWKKAKEEVSLLEWRYG